jgi:hypothetical protein
VVLAAIGRDEAPGRRDARLGLLVSAMRDDPYPALRHIAWRALRSVASDRALAPSLFTSTDPAPDRARAIDVITALLAEPVSPPDPALAAELRARAAEIAIEIGE